MYMKPDQWSNIRSVVSNLTIDVFFWSLILQFHSKSVDQESNIHPFHFIFIDFLVKFATTHGLSLSFMLIMNSLQIMHLKHIQEVWDTLFLYYNGILEKKYQNQDLYVCVYVFLITSIQ